MHVIKFLFDTLRYPVALAVSIGLAAVLFSSGWTGLGSVMKLILSGIVMNGAALIIILWAYRLLKARRERHKAKTTLVQPTREDT